MKDEAKAQNASIAAAHGSNVHPTALAIADSAIGALYKSSGHGNPDSLNRSTIGSTTAR